MHKELLGKVYDILSREQTIEKKDELIYSLRFCNKNSGRLLYHNYFLDPNKLIKSYEINKRSICLYSPIMKKLKLKEK